MKTSHIAVISRSLALLALAASGALGAGQLLSDRLVSYDIATRTAAHAELSTQSTTTRVYLIPPLVASLRTGYWQCPLEALLLVAEDRDAHYAIVSALIGVLNDPKPAVREAARQVLIATGGSA